MASKAKGTNSSWATFGARPKASSSSSTSPPAKPASSLPEFLSLLSEAGIPMRDALSLARKLLPLGLANDVALAGTTENQLKKAGIADESERRILLAIGSKRKNPTTARSTGKRKRDSDLDRPLPTREEELEDRGEPVDLGFYEATDESVLKQSSVLINRAPVMTAWATVVGERQGFTRQEALSVAHTFTEMNAISKGVSIGIMQRSADETGVGPSQPYVELMGRKVPVIAMQDGEWRGLLKGQVADPAKAFGYVSRAFKQQTANVMGALRLLGDSFDPEELNAKGYGLYVAFRPEVEGWGKKAEMKLSDILDLRRHLTHPDTPGRPPDPPVPAAEAPAVRVEAGLEQQDGAPLPAKKAKQEEDGDDYDKYLDDDDLGDVDWAAVGV